MLEKLKELALRQEDLEAQLADPAVYGDGRKLAAIQRELKACTEPPMEMMELAAETLELTASILGKSNDSAASDLGVSALSLRAAIQGAWLNVLINIGSLKNKELAEDYRKKGEALLAKALPLADQIYDTVVKSM